MLCQSGLLLRLSASITHETSNQMMTEGDAQNSKCNLMKSKKLMSLFSDLKSLIVGLYREGMT